MNAGDPNCSGLVWRSVSGHQRSICFFQRQSELETLVEVDDDDFDTGSIAREGNYQVTRDMEDSLEDSFEEIELPAGPA